MMPVNNLSVAILVFPEVEVLDFTGPLEAFSCVNDVSDLRTDVFTLSLKEKQVLCRSNLRLEANFTLDEDYPTIDVLVIPGGMGVRKLLEDAKALAALGELCIRARILMSVCTGSLLLAKLGRLRGLHGTTHHTCMDDLKHLEPEVIMEEHARFCDNGLVLTAGGISAGIDLALHLIDRELGTEVKDAVRKEMEWIPSPRMMKDREW